MTTDVRGKLFVALAGIVAAQSVTALIWAGAAAERLEQLEYRMNRTEELIERTARLEEQAEGIRDTLARIERKLDHVKDVK